MQTQTKQVPFPPMFDKKQGTLINGVQLHTIKGIGFNQNPIKTTACYINQTKIAYLCGKNILIYDLLTETQKSFSRSKQQSAVSTFNCFKTMYGEQYIIYATKAGKNVYPQVSVLNVWKSQIKSYMLYDLDVESMITDVLLIGQGNRFVVLSKEEQASKFIIFNLDQTAPFYNQSIDLDVKGIFSLDSYSDEIYLFTDTEIYNLRYFKQNFIQKISLELLPNEKIVDVKLANMNQYTFTVITDQGYLILKRILSGNEVRQDLGYFETMENDEVVTKRKIPSAICVSESIIVIGYHLCEELTVMKIHNIDFNKRSMEKVKFNCPYLHKIVSMNFSEEFTSICLVVQFKEQDKYGIDMKVQSQFLIKKGEQPTPKSLKQHSLPPGRLVPVVFNFVLHQTLLQTFRSPIQTLMDDFVFHKPIINISLVPYKKVALILSHDKKLRAMKFDVTSISLSKLFLWQHQFNDQPITMDAHPSNFSVVFAFRQGVRIYTIGLEGITPTFYWNIKGCDTVKFSSYGHILAVSTLSTVYLLNPYSTQQMSHFSIHIGPIKELTFLNHDNYIHLQGQNGAVNIYTISGSRRLEYSNKATKSIASVYDSRNDMLVVSSMEGTTKFYKQRGTVEFGSLWTYPSVITNILVINEFKCILLATSDGSVRIHQWPITDFKHFEQNFTEKVLHDGPISNMKISHDMSYLISSSDLSIYITKLQHFCEGLVTTQSEIINLVRSHNRDYLLLYHLDKLALCSYLTENLREEKILQIDADKADNQDVAKETVIKQNEDHKKKLNDIETECNKAKSQKTVEFNNKINSLTTQKKKKEEQGKHFEMKHTQLLETSEEQTNQTLLSLYRSHDDLLKQISDLKIQQKLAIEKQVDTFSVLEKVETDEYQKKISKLEGNVNKVKTSYEYSMNWNGQQTNQKDQQNNILKDQLKETLNVQLFEEESKGTQLRKRNNRLLAENIRLKYRGKQLTTVMGEIQTQILDLYVQKKNYQDNLTNITKVLSQQDSIINHSENKAKQYLKKNIIETNKQQYLSHRTQQLEFKNSQLEVYLTDIQEKQKNMYEQFVKESLNQKQALTKWNESIEASEKLKITLKNLQTQKNQAKYSLQEMSSNIVSLLRNYPDGLEIEYQKIFQPDIRKTEIEINKGITNEEIEIKNNKVGNLIAGAQKKKKLNQTNDSIRKNILVRANHEAIALTSECNQLRYEQIKLEQALKLIRKKLEEAKKNSDDRASLSNIDFNLSSIDDKNFKKRKLPFELFQDQNKMKRMYQLLAKDDLTESTLENKLVILKQLKKMEMEKGKAPVKKQARKCTNDSSIMDATKMNSEGNNSLSLPSIHKKAQFSNILNSSMENALIDTSNILSKLDDDNNE